jgi:DnaJ-class molecular chaperone
MSESYYKILGVNEKASKDEIKRAYRSLSLKHHPDKNKGDKMSESMFQKISEAYETLGDDQKREEYDMQSKNPFMRMNSHYGDDGAMEVPIDEIFNAFFGMGGIPGMPFGMGRMPSGSNIHIFRNGVPINVGDSLQKPSPIVKTVTIDICSVLTGTTLPLEIERWIHENGNKVFEKETIYVDIHKVIDVNEIIILREKGNVINDRVKGDIKIFIKVENNTEFIRNGLDLKIDKKISLKESLCGFSFELKYINGKTYTLNNNKGSIIPPEYVKVIPNMGLTREGKTGNLLITFHVEFPVSLTDEKINKLIEIL